MISGEALARMHQIEVTYVVFKRSEGYKLGCGNMLPYLEGKGWEVEKTVVEGVVEVRK